MGAVENFGKRVMQAVRGESPPVPSQNTQNDWANTIIESYKRSGEGIEYPIFKRVVSIVADTVATMVTNELKVVDKDGNTVNLEEDTKARGALDLLTITPDGRSSAREFITEVVTDYCIYGAGIIYIKPGSAGVKRKLVHMRPPSSSVSARREVDKNDPMSLRWRITTGPKELPEYSKEFLDTTLIMMRFSRTRDDYGTYYFPRPPLDTLRPKILAGIAADYAALVGFKREEIQAPIVTLEGWSGKSDEKGYQKYADDLMDQFNSPDIKLLRGGDVSMPNVNPVDAAKIAMRDHIIGEIARFYGVNPGMLIPQSSVQGPGLEAMYRIWMRQGAYPHTMKLLDAASIRLLGTDGKKFALSPKPFLLGDLKELREFVHQGIGDDSHEALITREEARSLLGFSKELPSNLRDGALPKEGEAIQENAPVESNVD